MLWIQQIWNKSLLVSKTQNDFIPWRGASIAHKAQWLSVGNYNDNKKINHHKTTMLYNEEVKSTNLRLQNLL